MSGHTLWFPFRLPPGQDFNRDLSTLIERQVGSLHYALGKQHSVYYLRVEGFLDEAAARTFVPRIQAALMWIALRQNLSPEYSLDLQRVNLQADPTEAGRNLAKSFGMDPEKMGTVDCLLDTTSPAIYPNGSAVRFVSAGAVTVRQGYPPDRTIELACEGASFPHAHTVVDDRKLRVALDLYTSVIRESSANARFLTLVMALEALAPEEAKHPVAQQLVDEWMEDLQARRASAAVGTEEWNAYEALQRELGFRRETSIRQRIRSLVRTALSERGDTDAEDMAKEALRTYDQRSTLVHNGHLPASELAQATESARKIVRRVLEARFMATAM